MKAHQAQFRVTSMCRVFKVSGSGFYSWCARQGKKNRKSDEDEALLKKIIEVHLSSRKTYGVRRVFAALEQQEEEATEYAVRRLMHDNGIQGVTRRRQWTTTKRNKEQTPSEDLVNRDFKADRPDQLWVADATYIKTAEGMHYLATVLDVFSRRVLGWAMGETQTAELMIRALSMAAKQRGGDVASVIHHSDHGSQYTSHAFRQRCLELGVIQSMGSVGDCYDNSMAESLFASIECELLDQMTFESRQQAEQELFRYIDGFYNLTRMHSRLGYLSPLQYEKEYAESTVNQRKITS